MTTAMIGKHRAPAQAGVSVLYGRAARPPEASARAGTHVWNDAHA